MEEEKIETNDSQNVGTEETHEEDIDTLKQRNQSLYEQLKKAKGFERDENGQWIKKEIPKPEVKESKPVANSQGLSSKDLIAIMQNQVHEEDIDDVIEVATLKHISVAEALKLDLTKTILAKKSEYRKSAETANTAPARKGATKVSDSELLSKLSDGKVPEKGSEEAERLFWARRGGKR